MNADVNTDGDSASYEFPNGLPGNAHGAIIGAKFGKCIDFVGGPVKARGPVQNRIRQRRGAKVSSVIVVSILAALPFAFSAFAKNPAVPKKPANMKDLCEKRVHEEINKKLQIQSVRTRQMVPIMEADVNMDVCQNSFNSALDHNSTVVAKGRAGMADSCRMVEGAKKQRAESGQQNISACWETYVSIQNHIEIRSTSALIDNSLKKEQTLFHQMVQTCMIGEKAKVDCVRGRNSTENLACLTTAEADLKASREEEVKRFTKIQDLIRNDLTKILSLSRNCIRRAQVAIQAFARAESSKVLNGSVRAEDYPLRKDSAYVPGLGLVSARDFGCFINASGQCVFPQNLEEAGTRIGALAPSAVAARVRSPVAAIIDENDNSFRNIRGIEKTLETWKQESAPTLAGLRQSVTRGEGVVYRMGSLNANSVPSGGVLNQPAPAATGLNTAGASSVNPNQLAQAAQAAQAASGAAGGGRPGGGAGGSGAGGGMSGGTSSYPSRSGSVGSASARQSGRAGIGSNSTSLDSKNGRNASAEGATLIDPDALLAVSGVGASPRGGGAIEPSGGGRGPASVSNFGPGVTGGAVSLSKANSIGGGGGVSAGGTLAQRASSGEKCSGGNCSEGTSASKEGAPASDGGHGSSGSFGGSYDSDSGSGKAAKGKEEKMSNPVDGTIGSDPQLKPVAVKDQSAEFAALDRLFDSIAGKEKKDTASMAGGSMDAPKGSGGGPIDVSSLVAEVKKEEEEPPSPEVEKVAKLIKAKSIASHEVVAPQVMDDNFNGDLGLDMSLFQRVRGAYMKVTREGKVRTL